MLQMISWWDYIKWGAFGLVVYYGYVGVKFFPKELSRLWLGGRGPKEVDPVDDGEEEPEASEEADEVRTAEEGSGSAKVQSNSNARRGREEGAPAIRGAGAGKAEWRRDVEVFDPKNSPVRDGFWRRRPGRRLWRQGQKADGQGEKKIKPVPGKGVPQELEGLGGASGQPMAPGEEEQSLHSIAQALSAVIKTMVGRAAAEKTVKGELIFAMQELLDSDPYCRLKKSPFKEGINNLIRFEVESRCLIHLDAQELNGLWVR